MLYVGLASVTTVMTSKETQVRLKGLAVMLGHDGYLVGVRIVDLVNITPRDCCLVSA
jgi:hypothetical protein